MAVLSILQDDQPELRMLSRQVRPDELVDVDPFIKDLVDTMLACHLPKALGLSAPQIGRRLRIIAINTHAKPIVLVNPVILEKKGEQGVNDGCLSVGRGLRRGRVIRPWKLRVEYLTPEGTHKTFRAQGLVAAVIHHEVDHLNGVLFTDYLRSPARAVAEGA